MENEELVISDNKDEMYQCLSFSLRSDYLASFIMHFEENLM